MNLPPIMPYGITLITTHRCTSECENCCFACSPDQGRTMTFEEMKVYVDMCLEAYPDTISTLHLTGGECMFLGKNIDRILSYAKDKGLQSDIMSNAFWATDYEKAYMILKRLKKAGLASIGLSTGKEHKLFVPVKNVRDAAVAAARIGLRTTIIVENIISHYNIQEQLLDPEVLELVRGNKLEISDSSWMEFYNKKPKPRVRKPSMPLPGKSDPCDGLFANININPYGDVYACCGIGVCRIPQMRLGNVRTEPVKTLYERAFRDFLKIWLYTEGPGSILQFVKDKTGHKFCGDCSHKCDFCRTVFMDKTVIQTIKDNIYEVLQKQSTSYIYSAKGINEARTKRKKTPYSQADHQQIQ